MTVKNPIRLWDDFWFRPIPPTSIAVQRIAVGILGLILAGAYLPDMSVWLTDRGTLPLAKSVEITGVCINLFRYFPSDDRGALIVLGMLSVSSVFLILGLFTRISAMLVWACGLSLFNRNPGIVTGG